MRLRSVYSRTHPAVVAVAWLVLVSAVPEIEVTDLNDSVGLYHDLREMQIHDAELQRHGGVEAELGESSGGVSLVNRLFVPNDLGAAVASTQTKTPEQKEADAMRDVLAIRKQITKAYQTYELAKVRDDIPDAPDDADAEVVDVNTIQVGNATVTTADANGTANVSPEESKTPGESFEIDPASPWKVHLLFPNGTRIPDVAEVANSTETDLTDVATIAAIERGVRDLDDSKKHQLRTEAQQEIAEESDAPSKELDALNSVDSKMKQILKITEVTVSVKTREIEEKAKETAQKADASRGDQLLPNYSPAAEEATEKSKENAVRVRADGVAVLRRDTTKVKISSNIPSPSKDTIPEGPARYATFETHELQAIAQLSVDGLINNPEFQEWVIAKPHADVEVATQLRKKAYDNLTSQRMQNTHIMSEIDVLADRILEKSRAWHPSWRVMRKDRTRHILNLKVKHKKEFIFGRETSKILVK